MDNKRIENRRKAIGRWFAESEATFAEAERYTGIKADHISKYLSGVRKKLSAEEFEGLTAFFLDNYPNVNMRTGYVPLIDSDGVGELTYVSDEEEWSAQRAAVSSNSRRGIPAGEIPQIDGTIGAGNSDTVVAISMGGDGIETGAPVVGTWRMPPAVLRRRVSTSTKHLHFIECEGNSMEPKIRDGDVVLIDESKRVPNMPGIFALWEDGGQTIKQVEIVRGSDPLRFRLVPYNKDYQPYERLAEEVHIIGRYVARFTVD